MAKCCKKYNVLSKKIEQGKNRVGVVKITPKKLNKSIDFLKEMCQYKDSRDDSDKN